MRPTLFALALTLAAAGSAQAQDFTENPTYGSFKLQGGFLPDPHAVEMTAGGSVEVDVEGCDYGYVADAPDANFRFDDLESGPLYLFVEADEDTMLLVNGPDGTWYCDDDTFGDLNPLITIGAAADGLYNVWVGTYGEDMVPATLKISELDPTE